MPLARRHLLQSLATATASSAALGPSLSAQQPPTGASTQLSAERLRVLQPVLERRRTQLQPLRDFVLDDSGAPLRGPLMP